MHSFFFLCLDELHSWGSCQSQLWQLPPAPPLPVLMGTEQKQGWGGRGFQTHQTSRLIALLLNQAPLIKQSSSLAVLSPLASKYFPTLLWHAFLFFYAWMSCTAGAAARASSGSCHQHHHCPMKVQHSRQVSTRTKNPQSTWRAALSPRFGQNLGQINATPVGHVKALRHSSPAQHISPNVSHTCNVRHLQNDAQLAREVADCLQHVR